LDEVGVLEGARDGLDVVVGVNSKHTHMIGRTALDTNWVSPNSVGEPS
jgi:hypothetical protein